MDLNRVTSSGIRAAVIDDLQVLGRLVAPYPDSGTGEYDHVWFGSHEGEIGWMGVDEVWEEIVIGTEYELDPDYEGLFDLWDIDPDDPQSQEDYPEYYIETDVTELQMTGYTITRLS